MAPLRWYKKLQVFAFCTRSATCPHHLDNSLIFVVDIHLLVLQGFDFHLPVNIYEPVYPYELLYHPRQRLIKLLRCYQWPLGS